MGTKPLARNRLLALLNQLGASDPETLQSVGQEEYEIAAEKTQNQQSLKRLSKTIFRMAAAWGLESGFHLGADAMEVSEVCFTGQASADGDGNLWLWLAMFFMLALVVGLAVKGYFMLRRTATHLSHCWNQVADEDATQESRINMLIQKCESLENRLEQILTELKDEIQTVSNETSMVLDYAAGLHYSIVEHGGFLRNGLGLSHQQWVHLATLERANLVTARVIGSLYMRGLRQRFVLQGPADETDVNAMDTSDDGTMMERLLQCRRQQHLQAWNQFLEWLIFSRQKNTWDAWSAKSFGMQMQSKESF